MFAVFVLFFFVFEDTFGFGVDYDEISEKLRYNFIKTPVETDQLKYIEVNDVDRYENYSKPNTSDSNSDNWLHIDKNESNYSNLVTSGDCEPNDPLWFRPISTSSEEVVINPCKPEASRNASYFYLNSINSTTYSGFILHINTVRNYIHFWFFPSRVKNSSESLYVVLRPRQCIFTLTPELEDYFFPISTADVMYLSYRMPSGFSYSEALDNNPDFDEMRHVDRDINETMDRIHFAIIDFLRVFDSYAKKDLVLVGYTDSSKIIPYLMQYIDLKNDNESNFRINLRGCIIMDGFIDIEYMIDFGTSWVRTGLMDLQTSENVHLYEEVVRASLNAGNYGNVRYYITWLMEKLTKYYPDYENPWSEGSSYCMESDKIWNEYAASLHVGRRLYHRLRHRVTSSLMLPIRHILPELLNKNYKITYYNSQFHDISMYHLTALFFSRLPWRHINQWYNTPREIIFKNKQPVTYLKSCKNLVHFLVNVKGYQLENIIGR